MRTHTVSCAPSQVISLKLGGDHANGPFGRLLHDIERVMDMTREDALDLAPSELAQRAVAMLGQRGPLRADFAQGMMDGHQCARTLGQRIEGR